MRGGFVHTQCLVEPLVECCLSAGIGIRLEAPVGPGRKAGHVDALIGTGEFRIAVEAECSARRIESDLVKAVPGMTVFVFSEAQARQRLARYFPLFFGSKVRGIEEKNGSVTCG